MTDAAFEPAPPVPAPAADLPPSPPSTDEPPPSDLPAEPPAPRVFTQEEVDKILSKRLSKQQRSFERQHQQLLETALSRVSPQQPAAPATDSSGPPDPKKFEDPADYVRAVARFEAEELLRSTARTLSAEDQHRAEAAHVQAMQAKFQSQLANGVEKFEDFEDVALAPDLPITRAMAEVIAESEIGADMAYYLGKNPAEAQRIARLSPIAAAREMGRIEAKLATPAAQPSKAPTPPTPVSGAAKGQKDPSSMTDAEFAAWRQKQIQARNGR